MKFIHAADIHLDSALKGLQRYEGAPEFEVAGATREALRNLVQAAIREQVDFVLLAGDIYDRDWKDYNTGLFFTQQMARLEVAGIRVIAITGNHDAVSQITRALRLPGNVAYLSHDRSQTITIPEVRVAIHGRGYATRWVSENLVPHYPDPVSGYFNIGLLHTSADGKATEHETYAPCTVADLEAKGYDYWALGHVHQRAVLNERPYVLFAGCSQGRQIRETGSHGCTLVEVIDNDIASVSEIELDVVRWYRCELDATGLDSAQAVVDAVAEDLARQVETAGGRVLAARVRISGRTAAHAELWEDQDRWVNEVRNAATLAAADQIWIEKVEFATRPVGATALQGPTADLLSGLASLQGDLHQLEAEFSVGPELKAINELVGRLPRDLREEFNLENSEIATRILEDVQSLLLAKLTEQPEQ